MNKHKSLKSAQSLLERASDLYGFDNAIRGKSAPISEPKKAPSNKAPIKQNIKADNVKADNAKADNTKADNAKADNAKDSQIATVDTSKSKTNPPRPLKSKSVGEQHSANIVQKDTPERKLSNSSNSNVNLDKPKAVQETPKAVKRTSASDIIKPKANNIQHDNAVRKIDRQWLSDNNLLVPDGPVTALSEEYRIVKRQLLLAARGGKGVTKVENGERILICSANPNEGKTYTSVNLALSLASEKDNRVLLVDADFPKPSVLSTIGVEGGLGLMDALADPSLDVNQLVLPTDVDGLSILPAGSQSNQDTEYLAAARTSKIIEKLSQDDPNRIIIFDSPPALAASPASVLALHVGQVLMVVHADKTTDSALRDALNLLSGCDHVQLLLNRATFSPSGRKFGTYYGYGA